MQNMDEFQINNMLIFKMLLWQTNQSAGKEAEVFTSFQSFLFS